MIIHLCITRELIKQRNQIGHVEVFEGKKFCAEITKATKENEQGSAHHLKSKVAGNVFSEQHELSTNDIKNLRKVTNPIKLDEAET